MVPSWPWSPQLQGGMVPGLPPCLGQLETAAAGLQAPLLPAHPQVSPVFLKQALAGESSVPCAIVPGQAATKFYHLQKPPTGVALGHHHHQVSLGLRDRSDGRSPFDARRGNPEATQWEGNGRGGACTTVVGGRGSLTRFGDSKKSSAAAALAYLKRVWGGGPVTCLL